MNKQNQFVGSFSPYSKPINKASIQADNSVLQVVMPENVRKEIEESNQSLETRFEYFLLELKKIKNNKERAKGFQLVDDTEKLTEMLGKISEERVVFIKIFEEMYRSFKGFCSWISLTTMQGTYIVDLIKLRSQVSEIKSQLLENLNILKIGLCVKQQIQALQRDFSIFSRTLFDLKQVLSVQNYSLDLRTLVEQIFPTHDIPRVKEGGFYKKPNTQQELNYISLHSSLLPQITFFIQTKIRDDKTFFQACLINSKSCLETYECKFTTIPLDLQEQIKSKSPQDARIMRKLLKWRIHTGRIRDESCEYILPLHIIRNIVARSIKSVGQLLSLYESISEKQICRDYDQTILDIVNSKSSKIDLVKIRSEVNQCESLSDFVKLVGWNDCNWKNKNSESVRLFKQIISMDPIESSIIEDELAQSSNRILCNDDILDLFDYIPYFVKNDTKGLAHQHTKFLQSHKNRALNIGNQEQKELIPKKIVPPAKVVKVPESIEQIYELANEKKKQMKKEKKKSSAVQEKQQPFTIDVQKFLKSINWN